MLFEARPLSSPCLYLDQRYFVTLIEVQRKAASVKLVQYMSLTQYCITRLKDDTQHQVNYR